MFFIERHLAGSERLLAQWAQRLSPLLILVCIAGLSAGCSSRDPTAMCEEACEYRNAQMCMGSDGMDDCTTKCGLAQHYYDELVVRAADHGCTEEFGPVDDCLFGGGDYCLWDGQRCETEFDALNACTDAFCAANPDDPVCG